MSGHSLADTRSITSVTTLSHTPAHTSAAPALTEPSAFAWEVARRLTAFFVQQVVVAQREEQPGDGGLARRARDQLARELGELLARPDVQRVGVPDELPRPPCGGAVQLVEEMLFAGEVTVDRPFRDAGLFRDLGRGGFVKAPRGEQLERRAHQTLAGEVGLGHRARI